MGILNVKKYKIFNKSALILVLVTTLASSSLSLLMPAPASAVVTGTGKITVILSQNPSTPAKVTATRAAAINDPGGCGTSAAETVTLSVTNTSKTKNTEYSSPVLPCSGTVNPSFETTCIDMAEPWYSWNIKVSGSATGSGTARVACGTTVTSKVTVNIEGQAPTIGTISGLAIASGIACLPSNSYYILAPANKYTVGTVPFKTGGTELAVNSVGKFTIGSVKPGTYDLFINCVNNTVVSDDILVSNGVKVVAGKTVETNPNQTSGDANAATSDSTCESTGFSLSWIFCPILNVLVDASDAIYNHMIVPLLEIKPITVNDASDAYSQNVFKAWSNFRIYADIFLVIALLVLVFGQAIGGGLIDAYSAKKILPRLLIAAILINLSIYLVAFMVDITNIVGKGLISLITAPFYQTGDFNIELSGFTSALGFGAGAGAGIALAAGGAAVVQFLLVFVLLPLFLTFIAIVATLILRQAAIIMLLIFSPIAFALYCLPNTEKYFKKWWDLLLQTLLVYPIIAALIGLAKIVPSVVNLTAGTEGGLVAALGQVLSIIILFVPLALIPFAFKMSGGLIGKVSEIFNGLAKKGHKSMLGNPNNPYSLGNRTKTKSAERLSERNLSSGALGATFNPRNLFGKDAKNRRIAGRAVARNLNQAIYGKKGAGTPLYENMQEDSKTMGDLAKYGTADESQNAINGEIEAYERGDTDSSGKIMGFARNSSDHQQRLFASQAANNIGRTLAMRRKALLNPSVIGYELGKGQKGWDQATTIMRDIAGNDEGTYRSMVNEFQYIAKSKAGRADLAGATDGNPYSGKKAWNNFGLYEHANAKESSIAAFGEQNVEYIKSANIEDKRAAAVFYHELAAILPNSKGGVRDEIIKQRQALETAGVTEFLSSESGNTNMVRERVIDPNDSSKSVVRERQETEADIAKTKSRAYERPDPNKAE